MSLQEFNGLKRQAKQLGIPYADVKQCNLVQLRALVENWLDTEPATEQPAIDPEPATEQPEQPATEQEQPDFHTPARQEWAERPQYEQEQPLEAPQPVQEWAAPGQDLQAKLAEFEPAFSEPTMTANLLKRLGLPLSLEPIANKTLSEAPHEDLAQFGLKYVHHHGNYYRFSLNGVEKTLFADSTIAALLSSFELDGNLPN
jgi:DNA segregation ATPase FtsK/SpoIIIE-like protein